ncbi:hypothetical protein VSR01_17290 [Actinacidiphila sp. DG2A-62]|uniref:hypothetical protein n=1 Tax=Actinacidiphila sp. DG2A-62 TaxID=3108821 RepID=UPI002DBE3310|nr:hypothetical protein [Actinacidiphila sp. DG2A-62]MEC3995193.1 hypothetical protein [Actinacidiphila sp. DG2A-62]
MNQYVKAATRARLLAGVIRGRAQGHPQGRELRLTAHQLGQAAAVLLGLGGSHDIAERAQTILWRARTTAPEGFPTDVIGYASAPLTGYNPGMADLMPADPAHARRERALRARLLAVTEAGHLDSRDEDVVRAALIALIDVHAEHAELAAAVELHGRIDAHPTVYRPLRGARTGQHLPGRLAVFDGDQLVAELPVPFDITPGEIWRLIATVQADAFLIAA